MEKICLVAIALLVSASSCGKKQGSTPESVSPPQSPVTIRHSILTQNLAQPWEIVWGADNFIWMTERGGRISRVNPHTGAVQVVHMVADVQANGEGGLLGMALHPSFSANPFVYVSYNYNNNGYKEKVVRFTYNGGTLAAPLVLIDNIAAASIHNGSRLLIVGDKLFITTGDAADQPSAQNSTSRNGKILRINLDGSIPADNPTANNPVWSSGHRNPQGLVMVGDKLFASEHGPDSDDEINIIEKGRNYGWPNVKGFCNEAGEQSFCSANNVKEPVKTWTPTAAVCGMEYYNSDSIPQWKNSLLVVTLKNSRLYQLQLNGTQTGEAGTTEFLNNVYGRMRDVCVAPNGKVYICTGNGSNDKIVVVSR
jgi:glucose/arabinose dehydrogenase